jgi:hypothetical protein
MSVGLGAGLLSPQYVHAACVCSPWPHAPFTPPPLLLFCPQIGLFAVPFVTIVGWILGHPFSLGFDPFAALVLLLAVMHSAHMINDAESHWCVMCVLCVLCIL